PWQRPVSRALVNGRVPEVRSKERVVGPDEILRLDQRLWVAVVSTMDPQIRRRNAPAAAAVRHQRLAVVAGVQRPTENQLFFILEALDAASLVFRSPENRQEQRREDDDDGDDDQQLDQS